MSKGDRPDLVRRIKGPEDFAKAFDVSRETTERLVLYEGLLRRWQKAVNLVAISTLDEIWHRHFADSAQIVAFAPDAATWLDLGTGAGFPGLVVAMLRAEAGLAGVTVVESDARKCAFLRETARQTGIAVDIINERIELAATQAKIGRMEVVSARALAPLPRLLGLAAPMLSDDTTCLFLKGRDVDSEIAEAREAWRFDARLVPSLTEQDSRVCIIRRIEANEEG